MVQKVTNSGSFLFDTKKTANTPTAKIKIEAAANGKTNAVESKTFRIGNFFFALTDTTTLKHISGRATGFIIPGIADSSAITGNEYQITFDSLNGSLVYNVKNLTTNQAKLIKEPMTAITGSGRLIDGLRIWFDNHKTEPDTEKSRFDIAPFNVGKTINAAFSNLKKQFLPVDFSIAFSSMDTSVTGNYNTPVDSFPPLTGTGFVKVPFKIKNITDTTSLLIRIAEKSGTGRKPGRWDFDEDILFILPPAPVTTASTLHADVIFKKIDFLQPHGIKGGETFYLIGKKSFTVNDVYQFTADVKYGKPTAVKKDGNIPAEYVLEQNYPNPFNPETKILFSLARQGWTTLTIFDAIGREVKTLYDEELLQGNYTAMWDGKNMYNQTAASGVYFYRLHSGSFTQTKKMVLMR